MAAFIDGLLEAIDLKGSCAMVGLDPRLELLPPDITKKAFEKHGENVEGACQATLEFCQRVIDVTARHVPAVKLQAAFFELFGWQGMRVYDMLSKYAQSQGLLVIGDVKRCDVGSTAEAYARGYLGPVAIGGKQEPVWDVDAVTVNAYLGWDGIQPFVEIAGEYDKGVFILVKTSNISSGQLQDLVAEGRPVHCHLAELINYWKDELMGLEGYSSLGAVVAATFPKDAERLRKLMPQSYFLVPGYGAQGATAKDVLPSFNEDRKGAIVSSSRGVIFAYHRTPYANKYPIERWEEAVEDAVLDMNEDLNAALAERFPQF